MMRVQAPFRDAIFGETAIQFPLANSPGSLVNFSQHTFNAPACIRTGAARLPDFYLCQSLTLRLLTQAVALQAVTNFEIPRDFCIGNPPIFG